MSVMDFLENANDLSNARVRLFDCGTESIVFDSIDCEDPYDPVNEIYMTDMADCEVGSHDLYLHNGKINLELNIDYEPEDDENDTY